MANDKITDEDVRKLRQSWVTLRSMLKPDITKEKMLEALLEALRGEDVVKGALEVFVKVQSIYNRQEEAARREEEEAARPAAAGAGHANDWESDSEEEDDDEPEEEVAYRLLRFVCTDRRFGEVENLACYRYVIDDEARKARGERHRIPLPYGIEDSASVRFKIENYRVGITGRGNFGGGNGQRYATKTIRLLCDFNPTRDELDEAVAYYRRNAD
jgi:hypothetical protein